MDEAEYWSHLEYRVCGEFHGMRDNRLHFLGCDGFMPEEYLLDDGNPRITGRAWISNGSKQGEWEFMLAFQQRVASRDALNWEALIPPENVTRWLAVDEASKRIEINLATATPHAA